MDSSSLNTCRCRIKHALEQILPRREESGMTAKHMRQTSNQCGLDYSHHETGDKARVDSELNRLAVCLARRWGTGEALFRQNTALSLCTLMSVLRRN